MAHVFEKKWRSQDVQLQENVDFSALLLSDRVLEGLQKAGFIRPSPIQLEAIPMGKFGKDLMVQAKSGTGKTLVFVIVALEMLKRKMFRPQILIVVPTREIAHQVCSVIKTVGSSFHKMTCNCFIGGLPLFEDQEKAVTTQIVVGTPGRLKQLIELKSLPTNSIRLVVFDEADELLHSNSFKEDLEVIYKSLPDAKQVIATSATFNPKVKKVMCQYLCDPFLIRLNAKQLALLGMVHYADVAEFCPLPVILYRAKLAILEKILKTVKFSQCLVFCNGIQRVEVLYKDIKKWGFSVAYISSAKDQADRLKAMDRLKRFKCKVLVSSDLTSRGIDAENVDLVVNFDLAYSAEVYMHRVGRAGRFGAMGVAISIIDTREFGYLEKIEKEGSFKTFKLPDPVPQDLILYPPEGEFVIDEPDPPIVDDSKAKKSPPKSHSSNVWDGFGDDNNDSQKEVSAESTQANGVHETNVDDNAVESELAAAENGAEKKDSEKELNVENIQTKGVFETCNDVHENTVENISPELAADSKPHDDNVNYNPECLKEDEDSIHSNEENIHRNENGYVSNENVKKDINVNSNLLNECDQNDLFNSESSDKSSACDSHEDLIKVCDKNAIETNDILNDIIENGIQKTDDELDKTNIDSMVKSSEPENFVKTLTDDWINCEPDTVGNALDTVENMVKRFIDKYESNIGIESTNLETKFDQPREEKSGKKLITIDMINNLQSERHAFFYKTFKTFQENKKDTCSASNKIGKEKEEKFQENKKDTCSASNKTEKEKEEKSQDNKDTCSMSAESREEHIEGNSNTDLVSEAVNTVAPEILVENSEGESSEMFTEKPDFESTPQPNNKTKENVKMVKDVADCKPILQNKLNQVFEELSEEESDSDDSDSYHEVIEASKETSSLSSDSNSVSSDSESHSSSSNSDDESGSGTESSDSDYSESGSDASGSSSTDSSEEDDDESIDESDYHHNYSRTGRQNPSLVSGSEKGPVLKGRGKYDKYYQDRRCFSCGGRKKEIPRDDSYFCRAFGNPPYFFDHREIAENYDTYIQDHRCTRCGKRKRGKPRDESYFGNFPYFFDQREIPCHRRIHQTRSRREQNFDNRGVDQSSLPRKHSKSQKSRQSRNPIRGRGDQTRSKSSSYRRSPRHHHHRHNLSCFMPTTHRCHPNTPEFNCSQGHICEMWYKTFYNQWLHIQNVIH